MEVWAWVLVGLCGILVILLLSRHSTRSRQRFEDWRGSGKSMLDDYDAEQKSIDRYSK